RPDAVERPVEGESAFGAGDQPGRVHDPPGAGADAEVLPERVPGSVPGAARRRQGLPGLWRRAGAAVLLPAGSGRSRGPALLGSLPRRGLRPGHPPLPRRTARDAAGAGPVDRPLPGSEARLRLVRGDPRADVEIALV